VSDNDLYVATSAEYGGSMT